MKTQKQIRSEIDCLNKQAEEILENEIMQKHLKDSDKLKLKRYIELVHKISVLEWVLN